MKLLFKMACNINITNCKLTQKVFTHGLLLTFGFLILFDSVFCQSSSSEFRFTVEPEDIVAVKDLPLLLNCSAQYMQQPTHMEWMRDEVLVNFEGDSRRQKLSNGSLHFDSIIHTRSHRPDEGIYQCVASVTDLGTIVSRKAKLQIAYLAKNFDKEPQSLAVHLGDLAVFECNMKGAPSPVIHWYKDDLEIDTNSVNYHLHLGGTLEISAAHFADFGRYKCKVENVGDKSAFSEEALLTQNSDISTFQGVAPHFILTPDDQVSLEGNTVEFHCAANGRDKDANPPKITWLKEGVTIDMADLDSRFSQMGQGSLRILNVLEQDEGMYTCRATNSEDSVDSDARLTVHVSPRFQRRPSNAFAQLHTDVEFHCDVFGVPEPEIQWMKNGETIINSQYFQISDGGRSLQILGLVETDSGVYQCFAENEVGNIQASAQLDIANAGQSGDRSPSQLTSPVPSLGEPVDPQPGDRDDALLASQPTSLTVPFVSTRFATLTWKPPNQIGTSEILNYTVYWKEDGSERNRMLNTSALEANIQGLEPSTEYNIRVLAVNRAGPGTAASVSVTTKDEVNVPGPPRNLKAETVSSMSIYLNWEAPSNPNGVISKYHVIHYKDGENKEHTQEVNEPEYTLTALDKFTNYNFYVVAFNQNGAGSATEEVDARTYSDVPSASPQNFTLEAVSSTTIVMRWEPPPKGAQNGIITGYKIRFKKEGDRKGSTVTQDANQRSFALTELERGVEYQVRMAALNVNGSGAPTEWQSANTYQYDLDESTVPGQPASLTTRPQTNSIMVGWIPPPERDIRIRGYILGYGKGIPDVYKQWLDHDQRFHTIKNLEPGTKYVISIKAFNDQGEGRPRLEEESTRSEITDEQVSTPMIPPVGLKARILSSTTILLTWTDTTLSKNQRVMDQRYYTVRYTPTTGAGNKYKSLNSTTVNAHIEGLKPNTEYDFSVKVIKGRRKSTWSLSAFNTTFESAPASAPRDLTPVGVPKQPRAVTLSWQPPRQANGLITGYVVLYTTDGTQRDREWVADGVVGGDRLSTTIRDLTLKTTYFFKVQARNSKGMGPVSPTVVYRTPSSEGVGGGRVDVPTDYDRTTRYPHNDPGDFNADEFIKDKDKGSKKNGFPPLVLYISIACVAVVVVIAAVVVSFIVCRSRRNTNTRKGSYQQANLKPNTNVLKPPDLWIHHEQVELKSIDKNHPDGMQVPEEMKPLNTDYSGDHSYDSRDNERYHRTPVRSKPIMISVEQPPPPREPIATAIPNGQLMVSDDDDDHSGVGHSTPIRPVYPRTQYTAHYTSTPRVNAGDFSQPSSVKPSQPQANSPYKKPNPPVSGSNSSSAAGHKEQLDNSIRSDTDSDIPKSFSTEELTAEMANLEGLMKDLNAITQQEFDC